MRYEPGWRKRARRERQWHRKFALFPKEVEGTKVWLEFYWRRYVPWPKPETKEQWDHWHWQQRMMLASRFMVILTWGEWELRLERQIDDPSNILSFSSNAERRTGEPQ